MKIQYCSDLHLEFHENKEFLKSNPLKNEGEILILAGDIVPFTAINNHNDFFDYISEHFKYTYWVPGNHEYYYSDISERAAAFNEKIRDNIFLVNNVSVCHAGLKFIFSTLWTSLSPLNQFEIRQRLSDFHTIKLNGKGLTPDYYNMLHKQSLSFLKNELSGFNNEKKIVVTHHVPTMFNYPPKYKGDTLNEAFAVELFDLIETSGTDYWLYGHTHSNTPDFKIGKTYLLTNQLGYVKYNEQYLFKQDAIINC